MCSSGTAEIVQSDAHAAMQRWTSGDPSMGPSARIHSRDRGSCALGREKRPRSVTSTGRISSGIGRANAASILARNSGVHLGCESASSRSCVWLLRLSGGGTALISRW
eukprot:Amastigsp_a353173_6.p6 type:complete len:108 gc:universal Amastigsp_a353173_6:477-800(+)